MVKKTADSLIGKMADDKPKVTGVVEDADEVELMLHDCWEQQMLRCLQKFMGK